MKYNREYMTSIFRTITCKDYHALQCVCFVKNDKELMRAWRKASDVREFLRAVRTDEALKWSAFAVYWFGTVDFDWYYRREYCGKFATKLFKTTSDIGAVKVGVDCMELLLSNYYGDGVNRVAVFDSFDPYVSWMFKHGGDRIRGKDIRVYTYDCGDEVAYTLSGSYTVHADDRFIAFVKYAD